MKAVLLHKGKKNLEIRLAHAVRMKEPYATIQGLLKKIYYEDIQWNICADLKVMTMLSGLQGVNTKSCCFLCVCDSRASQ